MTRIICTNFFISSILQLFYLIYQLKVFYLWSIFWKLKKKNSIDRKFRITIWWDAIKNSLFQQKKIFFIRLMLFTNGASVCDLRMAWEFLVVFRYETLLLIFSMMVLVSILINTSIFEIGCFINENQINFPFLMLNLYSQKW